MKIKLVSVLSIFLLYSCGFGTTEWTIDKLYVQKIEGTSKVIYNFSAWGGRDSNPHGFIILDSSKTFKVEVEKILPLYKLSNIPTKFNIEGVSHDCYGTCGASYNTSTPIFKPMKTEPSDEDGIKVTNRIYQYLGYSERENGLERYVFEKFEETKDSLFFFKLEDVESMDGIKLNELRVKKGGIFLHQNEKGEIQKIIVEEAILDSKTKEFLDGRNITLTPKNRTLDKEFTSRGIFREVKIKK